MNNLVYQTFFNIFFLIFNNYNIVKKIRIIGMITFSNSSKKREITSIFSVEDGNFLHTFLLFVVFLQNESIIINNISRIFFDTLNSYFSFIDNLFSVETISLKRDISCYRKMMNAFFSINF